MESGRQARTVQAMVIRNRAGGGESEDGGDCKGKRNGREGCDGDVLFQADIVQDRDAAAGDTGDDEAGDAAGEKIIVCHGHVGRAAYREARASEYRCPCHPG